MLFSMTRTAAQKKDGITLSKPLAFWFGFLVLGVIILLVVVPLLPDIGLVSISPALSNIAKGILYLPGSIIFPLIVALWIGERVGIAEDRMHSAVTIGLLNTVYTAMIYIIGIFMVFLVLYYSKNVLPLGMNTHDFLLYLVAIPVTILIVLVPSFSAMSAARHIK
ncbi:conserved hypothetical protein, membrane [mine drainage metagenome]|uniref:Uncharacterized protein n=1 Tax=mine drainage metagenome TaxID=410659 RepID=T1CD98_9ZZZZ